MYVPAIQVCAATAQSTLLENVLNVWMFSAVTVIQADEFTHMGMTVRTEDYRYTEWRLWDGHICEPRWTVAPSGRELYTHVGDIRPACFDCFENENIVDKEPTIASQHAEMLKAQFQHGHGFHSGCPHPPKRGGSEDRKAARQIYAEGGEKIPAELL